MNLNKKLVTKEGLLKFISDVDVYRFYTGQEVALKQRIKSPFREDNNPSFGYFVGETGEIVFRDFVLGSGDFVRFVSWLFKISYFEALCKIVVDFNLTEEFYYKENIPISDIKYDSSKYLSREELIKDSEDIGIQLRKKKREFTAKDYAYWLSFGIDSRTLEKYNVQPIEYIFINGNPIKVDKYAYAYIERKDGKESYKIYQPFNDKFKWLNNHNESVWQGWSQLPETGEHLVITKSLKDVMAIDAITHYPAVSLQAESVKPKPHVVQELKDRFKTIYVLYDNDFDKPINWGRELGKKLAEDFRLLRAEIPDEYKSKDFSDLVKNKGKKIAFDFLTSVFDLPF